MKNIMRGAIRRVTAAGVGMLLALSAHAAVVQIDQFAVVKNGVSLFTDTFSNNLTPTQESLTYAVTGAFPPGVESAGRLTLDSGWGALTSNAAGLARQTLGAQLLTNINPAFPGQGLTKADAIEVTGTFDIATPAGPLVNGYGVQLQDIIMGKGQDRVLELDVQYNSVFGGDVIRLLLQDFSDNSITTLGYVPFEASGADQIQLRIYRQDAASSRFFGAYALGSGGDFGAFTSIGSSDALFANTDFARARFIAYSEIPEPGTWALVAAAALAAGASRRRRSARWPTRVTS